MVRAYITPAVAGAFLLGMATAAMALTGEYGNMCTMGLALGKDIQTDCSIHAQLQGRPIASAAKRRWLSSSRTLRKISPRRRPTTRRSIPDKQGFEELQPGPSDQNFISRASSEALFVAWHGCRRGRGT